MDLYIQEHGNEIGQGAAKLDEEPLEDEPVDAEGLAQRKQFVEDYYKYTQFQGNLVLNVLA